MNKKNKLITSSKIDIIVHGGKKNTDLDSLAEMWLKK